MLSYVEHSYTQLPELCHAALHLATRAHITQSAPQSF